MNRIGIGMAYLAPVSSVIDHGRLLGFFMVIFPSGSYENHCREVGMRVQVTRLCSLLRFPEPMGNRMSVLIDAIQLVEGKTAPGNQFYGARKDSPIAYLF